MPTFLPPTDPFFINISSLYVATYKSIFGTDHLYNIDLYNELTPNTSKLTTVENHISLIKAARVRNITHTCRKRFLITQTI